MGAGHALSSRPRSSDYSQYHRLAPESHRLRLQPHGKGSHGDETHLRCYQTHATLRFSERSAGAGRSAQKDRSGSGHASLRARKRRQSDHWKELTALEESCFRGENHDKPTFTDIHFTIWDFAAADVSDVCLGANANGKAPCRLYGDSADTTERLDR